MSLIVNRVVTVLAFLALCSVANAQCSDGSCGLYPSDAGLPTYSDYGPSSYGEYSSGGCADGSCGFQPNYSQTGAAFYQANSFQANGHQIGNAPYTDSSYGYQPSYGGCADGSCGYQSSYSQYSQVGTSADYQASHSQFVSNSYDYQPSYSGCADGSCNLQSYGNSMQMSQFAYPSPAANYAIPTGCADGSCGLPSAFAGFSNPVGMASGCADGSCGIRPAFISYNAPASSPCAGGNCPLPSGFTTMTVTPPATRTAAPRTPAPRTTARRESMIRRLTRIKRIRKTIDTPSQVANVEQVAEVDFFSTDFPVMHLSGESLISTSNNQVADINRQQVSNTIAPTATYSAVPE